MRALMFSIAILLSSAVSAARAPADESAQVQVKFTAPERFIDATYDARPRSRERVTLDIAELFTELAARHLPPGQRMEVEVTEIDLAGRYERWRIGHPDVRFLRATSWPRLHFQYRLHEGDREISAGEVRLADLNYMMRTSARVSGDRLRYEEAMLEEWFVRNLGASSAVQAR